MVPPLPRLRFVKGRKARFSAAEALIMSKEQADTASAIFAHEQTHKSLKLVLKVRRERSIRKSLPGSREAFPTQSTRIKTWRMPVRERPGGG